MHVTAEGDGTQTELLRVKGADSQRRFDHAETTLGRAVNQLEPVIARSDFKLAFVVKRVAQKIVELLAAPEFESQRIAKPSGNFVSQVVRQAEHVHLGMNLAVHLGEMESWRWNFDRQVDSRHAVDLIEVGHGCRSRRVAGLSRNRQIFQLLLQWVGGGQAHFAHIAIQIAPAHFRVVPVDCDLERVAATFRRLWRHIAKRVDFVLLAGEQIEGTGHVVAAIEFAAACCIGELERPARTPPAGLRFDRID